MRKSKCDGAIPQCSACAKARKNLGTCSYQSSTESLPIEDFSSSLSGSQGLYPLGKQAFGVVNSANTLQSWNSSAGSMVLNPSLNTLNLSVRLEDFLEAHLLRLASAFVLTKDSCFNILFPTKRAQVVSEEIKDSLCCYGLFLSSHPDIFDTDFSFQARLDLAHRHYSIEPLLFLVSSNSFISMYHVYDSIRALIIRAFIALDTLHHVQAFSDLIKSAFMLMKKYDILNKQYLTTNRASLADLSHLELEEKVERLSLIALILNLDSTFAFDGIFQFEDMEIPVVPDLPIFQVQYYSLSPDDMKYSIWTGTRFQQVLAAIASELPEEGLSPVSICQKQFGEMKIYRQAFNLYRRAVVELAFDFGEQSALHDAILGVLKTLPINGLTQFLYESKIDEPAFSTIFKASVHQIVSVMVMFSSIHTPTFSGDKKYPLDPGGQCLYTSREIIFLTVKCLASFLTKIQSSHQSLLSPLLADISFSLPKIITICRNALECFKFDTTTREFALVWFMVSQDIQNSLETSTSIWPGLSSAKIEISNLLQQFN